LGVISKLPKSELIAYLRTNLPRRVEEEIMGRTTSPEDIPGTKSLLDDDIPELSQQPLQPTKIYSTISITTTEREKIQRKTGKMG